MLKNVLGVVGVLVFIAIAVLGGAVLTGYIVVDDPGAAASQILSGDFEDPEVSAEQVELGPLGAPQGSIQDIDTDGATFRNEFSVRNPNHLGGTVSLIEYDVYLAGSRGGPYERLGSGTVEGLEIPPNGTVTESNEFDVEYDDSVMWSAASRAASSALPTAYETPASSNVCTSFSESPIATNSDVSTPRVSATWTRPCPLSTSGDLTW